MPTMPQIGQSPSGQNYRKSNINTSTGLSVRPMGAIDTKISHGAADTREQFKGLPATGFTPGANENVGGGLLMQQRLRLMFIQLVQQGMSHKDAAKHIQRTTGFHARTGQRISAKVEHTKEKKVKYAGLYATKHHYRTRGAVRHPPRRQTPYGTPAGLK